MSEPTGPIRTIAFDQAHAPDASLEWLVTNGLGGYASGPVIGGVTRRYHGLLIAALPAPVGRLICLNALRVTALVGGRDIVIEHERSALSGVGEGARLVSFTLDNGLPVWRYEAAAFALERRLFMPYGQNTTHVLFRVTAHAEPVVLRLQPAANIRPHEARVDEPPPEPRNFTPRDDGADLDVADGLPTIRWRVIGGQVSTAFRHRGLLPIDYLVEEHRGYDHTGQLWTPGWIDVAMADDDAVVFSVSTEPADVLSAVSPSTAFATEDARRALLVEVAGHPPDPLVSELVLAADQFIIAPVGRAEEIARARAAGDEPRTVIAGYHWFTDWGRDTMISLEGLTLMTGREREAGCILRTFGHYVRDGLIPNLFPEGARGGLYHTADATLWFFHALERYVRLTGDHATLTALLPTLVDIADHHVRGTRFGIGVDPHDGLLRQGAPGYQLTWMDAKVGDWVVTPRRGKAVEINALWHNAVRLLVQWLAAVGRGSEASVWDAIAASTATSFNRRFWNPSTGSLFDVVDGEQGDDPACRPNQIFAISLDYPVLDSLHWSSVLDVVHSQLLTPRGLRTLSRDHPDYRPTYHGDLLARDAAYHQGTVWAWLIGPFIDAWRRVHPDDRVRPRGFLTGFVEEMDTAGVGSISEIFDAEPPFTPRGCIAQAWSVAEVLRAWRSLDLPGAAVPQPIQMPTGK